MQTDILFFNGWGMDHHAVTHMRCEMGQQLQIVTPTSSSITTPKNDYILIAWSMGVWAANRYLNHCDHSPLKSIAINGTPFGIDPQYGIPADVFQQTYDTLTPDRMRRLYRRIFGTKTQYDAFLPDTDFEQQKMDLGLLLSQRSEPIKPASWDFAWISELDAMYPTEAQIACWEHLTTPFKRVPLPHYLFQQWHSWNELIMESQ